MPAFATASDLATHLRRTFDTQEEVAANQALELATGLIQQYTGQQLFAGTSTETFHAPANFTVLGGTVVLRQRPIREVTSVKVNDVDADYVLDEDAGIVQVSRFSSVVTPGAAQTVTVEYDHGYEEIPAFLKAICLDIARQGFANPDGIVQESVDGYSYSFGSGRQVTAGLSLSERHEHILASLRR